MPRWGLLGKRQIGKRQDMSLSQKVWQGVGTSFGVERTQISNTKERVYAKQCGNGYDYPKDSLR